MNFEIKNGEKVRTILAVKDSATVIPAGSLVAIDANGLIIPADASSTAVAYAPNGAGNGETTVEITIGNDFTLVGTADANFSATDRGITCDIVIDDGNQQIDLGTYSTNVLQVSPSVTAGTVGSKNNVEVKINKPIF